MSKVFSLKRLRIPNFTGFICLNIAKAKGNGLGQPNIGLKCSSKSLRLGLKVLLLDI